MGYNSLDYTHRICSKTLRLNIYQPNGKTKSTWSLLEKKKRTSV